MNDPTYGLLLKDLGEPDNSCRENEFEFFQHGLMISTDSSRFARLYFHFAANDGEPGWSHGLPEGISTSDRMEDIERKLGKNRRLRRRLGPDIYSEMYDVSPYVLSVCFDLETEQMWMLSVEYVGVFSDTSELNKSFSMQLTDGMTIKLFEKGTEIPDYRSHVVSPTDDGQHAIEIRVLQAQAGSDSDNELYAQYWVQQVPQGAKGAAKVEIRVEALIDGNLKMAALDMQTRRELPVSVYP